jgi:DNA ligase-1
MFKPLLAATYEHGKHQLEFPVLGSPKLDGIRCLVIDGIAFSRTLKPIRNEHIQGILGRPMFNGMDGELIVGKPTGDLVYNRTNSGVMSVDGEPDFKYYVFDKTDMPQDTFIERIGALSDLAHSIVEPAIELVVQHVLENQADFNAYELEMLDLGFEGIMVRSPTGKYKYGRSTSNEGILWKVKRFTDFEAVVVDIKEAMHNSNPVLMDHLGRSMRSKHQENMSGNGMVGALVCEKDGVQFNVAPGTMNHLQRGMFWQRRELLIGKVVKVKSFEYGVVDQPRFARFHGFRDSIDH